MSRAGGDSQYVYQKERQPNIPCFPGGLSVNSFSVRRQVTLLSPGQTDGDTEYGSIEMIWVCWVKLPF